MMDSLQSRHITYLTEEVRRLITAGQVVRKPCDVVKELFENSLDAGAKNITVFIDEGGYRRIIVEVSKFQKRWFYKHCFRMTVVVSMLMIRI